MKELEVNKIHNIDCLEFMKTLPDKCVDLVLTDPPYGLGQDKGVKQGIKGSSLHTRKTYTGNWDSFTPTKEYFDEMLRVGKVVIIFGGNCFSDKLPQSGHWIVWDKMGQHDFETLFSDCELAWTSIKKKPIKRYIVVQQGFIAEEKVRFHPTQKPVKLFGNIINDYSKEGDLIFDPFIGAGTTAIACKLLKRNYLGCEISPEYCKITEDRIKSISNPLF